MLRMHAAYFLIVTAFAEVGPGLLLLLAPAAPLALPLGESRAVPEALFVGRVAGAALLALGVACRLARGDRHGPARQGLLVGALIYDAAAAVLLAYAGLVLTLAGVALWPAVVLHTALAGWCVACLGVMSGGES
jgi:hypothetical protein